MIHSKKELQFYIMADRMMNRGCFKPRIMDRLMGLLFPDLIMDFLVAMRKSDYYNSGGGGQNFSPSGLLLSMETKKDWC